MFNATEMCHFGDDAQQNYKMEPKTEADLQLSGCAVIALINYNK